MKTQGDRYIGGGKLYFTPVGGGAEFEIGEVQEATINTSVEFAEAWSKDSVMAKLVERVAKKIDASGKFSTQKLNLKNTAMFMLGTETTETFEIGETLPDGTTATAQVVIPKITAGNKPVVEGQLKFIGDEDGAKKPVIVIPSVVLTPSGDLPLIVDEFAKLSFDFAILQVDDRLYDEYTMTVGA
ncbi:MAG: hypothetical protein AB7D96_10705 [Arcobacteraceae bacterium]